MKLGEGGREHEAGNQECPACDQTTPDGAPLNEADISYERGKLVRRPLRYPYTCSKCRKGLVHAEVFPQTHGASAKYLCDHCGK